jgi:hypothetical protein
LLAGSLAYAQHPPVYDPAQLPEVKGKVAQYTLTPRGDVDGLILADGTEVHLPPFLSTQVVATVKPGDAVTIHGLKARALAMVAAASITNDATGTTLAVHRQMEGRGLGTPQDASGKIKALLHEPRGEVDGVLLEDGTQVRLPPSEARRLTAQLAAGLPLAVHGVGYTGPLGHVIAAREIGPDAAHLTKVAAPAHDERGMMHSDKMQKHMRGGPDAPQRP